LSAEKRVRIGRVARAHGIRGEVAVVPDEPGSTTLLSLKQVWLGRSGSALELRAVRSARMMSGATLVQFEGSDDRTAAEAMRGLEVLVERGWLPELEPGEYYAADLVGLNVRNERGEKLGTVAGIYDAGAVPVLEIDGERSLQVPLAEAFVKRIDLAAAEIVIAPPLDEDA
jgi:16S rRNA processing protein RimM